MSPEANKPPEVETPGKIARLVAGVALAGASLGIGMPSEAPHSAETPTTISEPNCVSVPTVTESTKTFPVTPAEWNRQFEDSPNVGSLIDPLSPKDVAKKIVDSKQGGEELTKVEITGQASDDDNNIDAQGERTGGLGQPNADPETGENRNTMIAQARADRVKPDLETELRAEGEVALIEFGAPLEDILSQEEIKAVDTLAARYGYESTVQMIELFNRDPDQVAQVAPEVAQYLKKELQDERHVKIVAHYVDKKVTLVCEPTGEPTPPVPPKEHPHIIPVPPALIPGAVPVPQDIPQPSVKELRQDLKARHNTPAREHWVDPATHHKQPTARNTGYSSRPQKGRGSSSHHSNRRGNGKS